VLYVQSLPIERGRLVPVIDPPPTVMRVPMTVHEVDHVSFVIGLWIDLDSCRHVVRFDVRRFRILGLGDRTDVTAG
jgi:hypothetical protein